MPFAALTGLRGREGDNVAVGAQRVDETSACLRAQMLGHFERLNQVEAAIERKLAREISSQKVLARNEQVVLRHIVTIDAGDVGYAKLAPDREPSALDATDIEHAAWANVLDQHRDDVACRSGAREVDPVKEPLVVRLAHTGLLASRVSE